MSGPFEITKEMVSSLDDVSLRDLIRRLLEAEAVARGIPLSAIDVGGAQTASDSGIDALIDWRGGSEPGEWLLRRHLIVQCKATAMGPSAIAKEMRPKTVLRPIFAELAASKGAYVIATTEDLGRKGSKSRIEAMRTALSDLAGSEEIAVNVYSADKLARWANVHVGVAMWLRETAGISLKGWQPYGPWSGGGSVDYLVDDEPRAQVAGSEASVNSALSAMRGVLSGPRGQVRLVGISGMGKTRLAEALFEDTIGNKPLFQHLAVYGDAGLDLPTPPVVIAEQLVASRQDAVIIIDNGTDRLHRQIGAIVSQPHSRVSLLTIDYELESEPLADTLVVRLGENSDETIGALIQQRFPDIGDAVRQRLVEFSGGNARVAIAIARGVKVRDSLADLDDVGLLDRLFQEERRGGRDGTMRPAAEAAALVYAFHADSSERVAAEHGTLAHVAGLSEGEFYRAVERMLSFGIAQQRGTQRAIKPDAIADRLASIHLRYSDPTALMVAFQAGPERLRASFARRLGRLHKEPKATALAQRFLAPGGWLSDIPGFDELQVRAFLNLAAAAPLDALRVIQAAIRDSTFMSRVEDHREYADLLAHIAWDATCFTPAMYAMRHLATAEPVSERTGEISRLFLERFRPALSFTMAETDVRIGFVDKLLLSKDPKDVALGMDALDSMLETGPVSSSFQTEFGTRNQHREWRPRTESDFNHWFGSVYSRLEAISASLSANADHARSIVASNIRSNVGSGLGAQAAQTLINVKPAAFWDQGWRAASEVLHFDRGTLSPQLKSTFENIERSFRPRSPQEAFDAFVLSEPWQIWHPNGNDRRHTRDVRLLARATGVAYGKGRLELTGAIRCATKARHGIGPEGFARGLASRVSHLDEAWQMAVESFKTTSTQERSNAVLSGLMSGAWLRDRSWVEARLGEVTNDPDLAPHIIALSPRDSFDGPAIDRLIVGLDNGTIPPARVGDLMYGGLTDAISVQDLVRLLKKLITHTEGAAPALHILFMRKYSDANRKKVHSPEFRPLTRLLLADPRLYGGEPGRNDHELAALANDILPDRELAMSIAKAIKSAEREPKWRDRDLDEVKAALVRHHLDVVLDEFVADETDPYFTEGLFGERFSDDSRLPLTSDLDEHLVREWVSKDFQSRAEKLARLIPYALSGEGGGPLRWSPLALALIDKAPEPIAVLEQIEDRFYSGVSTGPFYLRYKRRIPLMDELMVHPHAGVRAWAGETRSRLEALVASGEEREREQESHFE